MVSNFEATREQLRRDVRGLGALESIQMVIGIGVLLTIAVRAIFANQEGGGYTAIAVILALAYLAMGFRMRLGAESARRELWLFEAAHLAASARTAPDLSADPYRPLPREVIVGPRPHGLRLASHAVIAVLAAGVTLASVAIWGS